MIQWSSITVISNTDQLELLSQILFHLKRFPPFIVHRYVPLALNRHSLNVDKNCDAKKPNAKHIYCVCLFHDKLDFNSNLGIVLLRLSGRFNWTNQGSKWERPIKPVITTTGPPRDKQSPNHTIFDDHLLQTNTVTLWRFGFKPTRSGCHLQWPEEDRPTAETIYCDHSLPTYTDASRQKNRTNKLYLSC